MARIRTIKPEFWSDEKLGPLEPLDRLVFLGLVSQADDGGRLVDSVRLIDGLLFGQTGDSCCRSLYVLDELGVIQRGMTASGQRVIQIVGWEKHQKVDKPSRRGILPVIDVVLTCDSRRSFTNGAIPESLAESSPHPRENGARDSRYEVDLGAVDLGPWTVDRGPGSSREERDPSEPIEPPDQPTNPEQRKPEPQTAAVVTDPLGGFLDGFPEIAELVTGLRHEGGAKATAATLLHRFLFPDGEETLADPVVKGLRLEQRVRLVQAALLEFATQAEPFQRPHFTGFVKRIRDAEAKGNGTGIVKLHQAAPADDEPPPDPELQRAGFALIKAAANGVGSAPQPDPEKARSVEQKVREQKAKIVALTKRGAKT